MTNAAVTIGEVYVARVGDRPTLVRVDSRDGYWVKRASRYRWTCTNLRTGRTILVLSAQRFREHVPADQVQARLDVIH